MRLFSLQDGSARLGLQCNRPIKFRLSAPESHRRGRGLLRAAPCPLRSVPRFTGGAHDWVVPLHPLCAQLFDEGHLLEPRLLQFRWSWRPVSPIVAAAIVRTRGPTRPRLMPRAAECLSRPLWLVASRSGGTVTLATAPSFNALEPLRVNRAPARLCARGIAS